MTNPLPESPSILDRIAHLPVEIQRSIILEIFSGSSACALALFVPDWDVCAHGSDQVNGIYDLQRTDVYRRGVGGARGTFASGVSHCEDDHMSFTLESDMDPHAAAHVLTEQLAKRFPAAATWALRDLGRTRLCRFQQRLPREPDDDIGKYMSTGALVFGEEDNQTARGDVLCSSSGTGTGSQMCEAPRHLMFNSVPRDPWLRLRLRRNPEAKLGFGMRLLVETAEDIVEVDWAVMPQLETVFLDLRSYGRGPMEEAGIRKGAARMCCCLGLQCLVIAGLRSGTRYARSPGWEACDWETDDREVDGGVNWVKAFCGAVREGGRLVFIDRRILEVNWRDWRTRAESSGLLLPGTEKTQFRGHGEGAYLAHVEKVLDHGGRGGGGGDRDTSGRTDRDR
ncbi:urea transport protein [Colletotrichum truncatum]|uniref:Urea transport protein n=1 Tax=Colletotrichum truncatum TaxID=5467 RepID=A0ACC3YWW2_COLTU|nr:urea transport protein [Colletotrichum truncatum]KAF6781529.1 urea transport protein [Colletotrichum truncatum]